MRICLNNNCSLKKLKLRDSIILNRMIDGIKKLKISTTVLVNV